MGGGDFLMEVAQNNIRPVPTKAGAGSIPGMLQELKLTWTETPLFKSIASRKQTLYAQDWARKAETSHPLRPDRCCSGCCFLIHLTAAAREHML